MALLTLPGESALPHCSPVSATRAARTNTRSVTFTTGIYSLAGLEDRCPKSNCLQGLLPLEAWDRHSSVTFPAFWSLWYPWHSNICAAFTCPSSLCLVPLFHLLFSEEHLSVDLGPTWSTHCDLMLTDSFGKVLFPSKVTVGIFGQTFIGGEGDTMGSTRILYCVLKVICSAVAECIVLSISSRINLVDM